MDAGAQFCTKCGSNVVAADSIDPAVIVIDDAGRADVVQRVALPPLPVRHDPLVVSTKAPADPKTIRRTSVVVIAVSMATVLASIALLVVTREPGTPPVDVNAVLDEGATTLVSSVRAFRGRELLADFAVAAESADSASDTYADRLDLVAGVDDPELRDASRRVLRAERRVLREFASALAGVQPTTLENWGRSSLTINEAIDGLDAADADLQALGAEEVTTAANVNLTRRILASIDEQMADKLDVYRSYRSELEAAEDAQGDAARINGSYVGAVEPLIDQYSDSRENLQTWTAALDTSATPQAVYATLGLHSVARVAVYNALIRITPNSAFEAAHGELIDVVSQAVDVVETATSAVDTFLAAPLFEYRTVQETPEWQYFMSESDRISAEYAAVLDRWEQVAASEQARIAAFPMPVAPVL